MANNYYSSDNIKSNTTNLVCKSQTSISQDLVYQFSPQNVDQKIETEALLLNEILTKINRFDFKKNNRKMKTRKDPSNLFYFL